MIHRFWMGPVLAHHHWIQMAVTRAHPHQELVDWTPQTLPSPIRELVDPADPRHSANLIRYALLLRRGGLWLDHDLIPLVDLTRVSRQAWTASLAGRREGAAMWFPQPGHPMLAALEALSVDAPHSGAPLLQQVGADFPEVGVQDGILPIDATGRPVPGVTPLAVHLWDQSGKMHGHT